MDALLLPMLLGALLGVLLCARSVSKNQKPSFWLALYIAVAIGGVFTLVAFGFSLFTGGFWTDNPTIDPAIAGVLIIFGIFALAGLVPAFVVVVLYRIRQSSSL